MKTLIKKGILIILVFRIVLINAQVVDVKDKTYKKAVKIKTKEFTQKGYTSKGAATIDIYLSKAMNKEFEEDENGEYKNSVIYTSALSPTFNGALTASRASARVALAGNIETSVGELIERSLNSEQITARSAEGINKTVTAGKQLIAQKVSTEDLYTFYREVKDENDGKTLVEVEFAAFYSKKLAMQKAKEFLMKEMENETEELHKDLDKIFKLN